MPAASFPLAWVRAIRPPARFGALALVLAGLCGCNSVGLNLPGGDSGAAPPPPTAESAPAPGMPGDAIGSGPVRVGAVLPLTQNGAPSAIGQSLRNAAQLAVEESGSKDITLIVEDDRSTPEGATQAVQAELDAGAEIILGPLFAPDVRAVAPLAKGANKPVIAFSTDSTVASSGVYLLSFLIESYVDRIMDFAASRGKRAFAVLAPEGDYANVVVTEAQIEAAKLHVKLVTVARYPPGQPATGMQQVTASADPVDALLVAEQADGMPAVNAALAAGGVTAQILGTGVWNDPRVLKLPGLQGAWFSAPENAGFNAFAARYKAKFNSDPARLSTLAYDAVSLVAALARTQGAQRYSATVLTNASGFNGADGVFRFRADGPNERGLAVMQIGNGAATVISPAPKSFAGG